MFDYDDLSDFDDRDPRNPSAFRRLDRFALNRAVQALRHLDQFHTVDVIEHPLTKAAHLPELDNEDFPELVEAWLSQEALFLGLRGPLPGHRARGKRWAWQIGAVDPSNGQGGDPGPTRR